MPNTVQNSVAVRNAMMDAWETAMGTGVKIRLYTGAQPTNCAAAETGTMLVEWVMPSDYSPNAAGGVKTLGTPVSATAAAGGTAAHYRIYDAAGTTCHEQGSVTAPGGGGDSTLDNTTIVGGQTVNIDGWTKTAAGA